MGIIMYDDVPYGANNPDFLAPTPFIYSEDEEQVGIWIDGKPLYAKTFKPTSPTTANTAQVVQDITSLNIDVPVNLFGNISNVPINWTLDSSNGVSCFVTSAKTGIAMKVINSLLTNITCNITIQYTKTTDTAWQGGFKAYGFTPVIYSDIEREIGVWRDGKPLYQKTVFVGALPNNSTKTVAHNISDYDFIVSIKGSAQATSDPDYNEVLPFVNVDYRWNVQLDVIGANIKITTITDASAYDKAYVTLQYTKTTDTAGSGKYTTLGVPSVHYSTDEQIIGTWIDGSTLYQKTVEFGALPNATIKDLAHNISNVDNIWISGGFAKNTSGDFNNQLVLTIPNSTYAIGNWYFGVTKTNIRCVTDSDRTNYSAYVTLQYTKTS